MNRPSDSFAWSSAARALAWTLAFAVAGCKSAAEHRDDADREVYELLQERRAKLGLADRPFTIERNQQSLRERLLRDEAGELGALSMVECLDIAAENSRDYQAEREDLYLLALDLTLERWRFGTQYSTVFTGLVGGLGEDASSAEIAGGPALSRLLGSGARIVSNLGLTVARDLSQGDAWSLTTNLGLVITQPLLRGAGERIVKEPLTQAERDVVYGVRDYERFRRTFAVEVANRYYRLLQQIDAVRNQESNYQNLIVLRQRNEALAEAGRLSDIQVDQALQDELRSRNRLIEERQRLSTQLDQFKLFLGLPIETPIELDPGELARLNDDPPEAVPWQESAVIALALEQRLDYLTVLDRLDDAGRRAEVAADALRAGLNLTMAVADSSDPNQPLDYDLGDSPWTARLDLDLPVDLIPQRNSYRTALIEIERRAREIAEQGDSIRADLRTSLGSTIANLEAWRIQLNAVELAMRRVESTSLNLDAGRSETRDLLEAQEALLEAQNAATGSLIDYHLANLALLRDAEALRVDDQGIQPDPELVQRMQGILP